MACLCLHLGSQRCSQACLYLCLRRGGIRGFHGLLVLGSKASTAWLLNSRCIFSCLFTQEALFFLFSPGFGASPSCTQDLCQALRSGITPGWMWDHRELNLYKASTLHILHILLLLQPRGRWLLKSPDRTEICCVSVRPGAVGEIQQKAPVARSLVNSSAAAIQQE